MIIRPFFAKLHASSVFIILCSLSAASYIGCSSPNPDDTTVTTSVSSSSSSGDGGSGGAGGAGGTGGVSSSSSSGSGGSGPCDPAVTTCGCLATTDCPTDMLCIGGLCIIACNTSYECGGGKICVNGQCEVGCSDTKPCDGGYKCIKGYCVEDPTNPECTPMNPCPTNEVCANGICEMPCVVNTDCPTGEVCNGTTGGCIPTPFPVASCGPAKPCPGASECGPQGYCQYGCTDVNACKLIDSRFTVCDQGVCKTLEETNPQCTLTKPCPVGQDCVSNQCK